MKILVTIPQGGDIFNSFIYPATIERMRGMGELILNDLGREFTEEEFCEKIKGVDILVEGWCSPQLSEAVMANADSLKYFIHTGGAVASYVCEEVYKRGVKVLSGNELYAESVAEGVVAYILTALRRIPHFSRQLAEKNWCWSNLGENFARGLLGRSVGIVSYGSISKYLIPMLQPFRVNIKLYSRRPMDAEFLAKYNIEQVGIDEIFETCDIITMQTALNEHTIDMITKKQLDKIKDGALFINTSRGPIVNEADLIAAVKEKRFDVVLDVYNQEPPPADSGLYGNDNLMMMPHMAGPTIDRRDMITNELLTDVQGNMAGAPLANEVPWERAEAMTVSK